MKKAITIRISNEVEKKLNELVRQTGKTKTELIELSIMQFYSNEQKTSQQIELLSKQNEQLQMVVSATKALIKEKDAVIKAKDELIEELRKRKDKKGFFAWLFGKKE